MRKLIPALIMPLISGCATIVASGPDHIPVSSSPAGATVYLNETPVGVTPITLSVKRSDDCRIRIEMKGYEPYRVDNGKVLNGWVFGDLLIPVLGIAIDLATSNQGLHPSGPITANLIPIKK